MKKMNKKGFTIVELVIVIAVIAILTAVMIPTFPGIVEKANESRALQEVKNAYTVALSEVLADGVLSETTYDYKENNVSVYTFTFANGALTAVVDAGTVEYTYTVTNGDITKATTKK